MTWLGGRSEFRRGLRLTAGVYGLGLPIGPKVVPFWEYLVGF